MKQYWVILFWLFYNCNTTPSNTPVTNSATTIVNDSIEEQEKTVSVPQMINNLHTWNDLKKAALDNKLSSFRVQNFIHENLISIDTTVFGTKIRNVYALESTHIVSVKNNIGKFYPCVVLGTQYDSDKKSSFLAVFMIDSTFSSRGDVTFIAADGTAFNENWEYTGVIKDAVLQIDYEGKFECDELSEVSELRTKKQYEFTSKGEINLIRIDTLVATYCN